jgi:hypothetical protein
MKDEREIRLEVLLHESEQVHDTLARTLTIANTLFGAVLPVGVGFLLYTAGEKDKSIPLDVLAVALALVVSLAAVFNAGLWVEISRYIHYKYVKIYPELYKLASLRGENFGQYLAREQRRYPSLATVLFHLTMFAFSAAAVWGGLLYGANSGRRPFLLGLCGFLSLVVAATYVWALPEVIRNVKSLIKSGEAARKEAE